MTAHRYDRIGQTYSQTRRPDPRIAKIIASSLAGIHSVVNVGAGAGSYEPVQTVLAVEPSDVMIRQRSEKAPPAIRASAENLPLSNNCVDAAMAVLTVHHWHDLHAGIGEMARVARRRVVVFTWDHRVFKDFWLLREYVPAAARTDEANSVPLTEVIAALPGTCTLTPVPIPHDCADGFGGAYWRRPHAYLDMAVRAGISMLALTPEPELVNGLAQLRDDLAGGAWRDRHRDIVSLDELDLGYRLLVADL